MLIAGVKNIESAKVAMATNETSKNPNPNPRGEALKVAKNIFPL